MSNRSVDYYSVQSDEEDDEGEEEECSDYDEYIDQVVDGYNEMTGKKNLNNKLFGEIQVDDKEEELEVVNQTGVYNQSLEFDTDIKQNKKKLSTFKPAKTKVEDDIGIVKSNLWKPISKNELAAKGFDLKIFNKANNDLESADDCNIEFIDPNSSKVKKNVLDNLDEHHKLNEPCSSMNHNENISLKNRNKFLAKIK